MTSNTSSEHTCDHAPLKHTIATKCRHCGITLVWNAEQRIYQPIKETLLRTFEKEEE